MRDASPASRLLLLHERCVSGSASRSFVNLIRQIGHAVLFLAVPAYAAPEERKQLARGVSPWDSNAPDRLSPRRGRQERGASRRRRTFASRTLLSPRWGSGFPPTQNRGLTPAANRWRRAAAVTYLALTTLALVLGSGCTPRNKWTCIRVPTGRHYSTREVGCVVTHHSASRDHDIWVIEKPAPTDFSAVNVCVESSTAPRRIHIIEDGSDIVGIEETPDGHVRTIHKRLPSPATHATRLHVWQFQPTECTYKTRPAPPAAGACETTYTTVIINEGAKQ